MKSFFTFYGCIDDQWKLFNVVLYGYDLFGMKEVIEKVQELDQEKMKTEKAFHDFLPLTIVRDIKLKKVVIFIRQFTIWTQFQRSEKFFEGQKRLKNA